VNVKNLTELISAILFGVPWLAGIVLAKGFWSTTAAVCIPPYAWYLVVERIMIVSGFLI
jgi:hypothetical protein